MIAPEDVVLRVTVCVDEYVPAAGLAVGVAACGMITYAADPTAESVNPEAMPIAFKVSLEDTLTVPLYKDPWEQEPLPLLVGVLLSVV